jgi:hypothetical protein
MEGPPQLCSSTRAHLAASLLPIPSCLSAHQSAGARLDEIPAWQKGGMAIRRHGRMS